MLILRLLALLLVLVPFSAHAVIYETNEWANKTQAGWSYSGTTTDNATDTPAGGGTIRMQWSAGNYPVCCSIGGGRAEYGNLPAGLTELYIGHWVKWSNPYDWNPVGSKIDYMITRDAYAGDLGTGKDNFLTMIQDNGTTLTFTQQLWMDCTPGPCTRSRTNNVGSINIIKGRWYWLEIHVRYNTVGVQDGLIEIWLDDVLKMQHSNVTYRTTNTTIGNFQHSPEWGGGGGVINQTQYVWFDHTVLSSTRIGMPGGVPVPTDTTPPTAPSSLVAQ